MSTTTTESSDRGVESQPSDTSLRPQLFTVPDGTYGSNGVYGAGVAVSETYESVTVRGDGSIHAQSIAEISKHGSQIAFSMSVALDISSGTSDPITSTDDELRIRTLPLAMSEPARYLNTLPKANGGLVQPLFGEVEFNRLATDGTAAPVDVLAGSHPLHARLLHGGVLALLKRTTPGGDPVPVIASDIGSLFDGAIPAYDRLVITVKGRYFMESSINI